MEILILILIQSINLEIETSKNYVTVKEEHAILLFFTLHSYFSIQLAFPFNSVRLKRRRFEIFSNFSPIGRKVYLITRKFPLVFLSFARAIFERRVLLRIGDMREIKKKKTET